AAGNGRVRERRGECILNQAQDVSRTPPIFPKVVLCCTGCHNDARWYVFILHVGQGIVRRHSVAQILVLADQDARISRIKNACDGWDTDVRWVTASVDQISMLDAAAWRACGMPLLGRADPIEPRLQAIKPLRAMNDTVRIVVTGIPSDDTKGRTETVFAYLEAGAAGYVGDDQLDSNLVHVL